MQCNTVVCDATQLIAMQFKAILFHMIQCDKVRLGAFILSPMFQNVEN